VPRHVAWLVTRLVVPLVVDYSASRRLVVDYFAYAARPGASARHVARHAARYVDRRRLLRLVQACRRLLCLRRPSECLGTSHDSSCGLSRRSSSTSLPHAGLSLTTPPRAGLSSTTSPTPRVRVPRYVVRLVKRLVARLVLVVDYFAYVARPGASARHAARHTAHRRLLRASRLCLAATLALL
jgi:hypothetical protein